MISVVLLSTTLLLVSTKPLLNPQRALQEIIIELNRSIPEDLANKLVPDLINKDECLEEDFCKAEKVLSKVKHGFMKEWRVVKTLHTYHKTMNETTDCTIIETGNELQLRELVKDLRRCAQIKYSKPNNN